MSFFSEILQFRTVQGTVESLLAKQKKRLVVKFKGENEPRTTNFDIIESFTFKQSVKITKNPVEQGVNINDHRIQQAMVFQMKVGVSNIINPVSALVSGNVNNIIQASSLQIFGSNLANSRIQATFNDLKLIMTNGEVFDIDTPSGILKNFLITNIDHEHNAESITTFEGLITFEEILFFDNLQDLNTNVSGVKKLSFVPSPILTAFNKVGGLL